MKLVRSLCAAPRRCAALRKAGEDRPQRQASGSSRGEAGLGEEKIVRGGFIFSRGSGRSWWGKPDRSAPFSEGESQAVGRGTLGFRVLGVERPLGSKNERGLGEGDAPRGAQRREDLRGGNPRRAEALVRINRPGGEEGHGFFGGRKPLERRCEAE
jgi:hypothetical protein